MDAMEPPMQRVLTAVKAILMEDARCALTGGRATARKTLLTTAFAASSLADGPPPPLVLIGHAASHTPY